MRSRTLKALGMILEGTGVLIYNSIVREEPVAVHVAHQLTRVQIRSELPPALQMRMGTGLYGMYLSFMGRAPAEQIFVLVSGEAHGTSALCAPMAACQIKLALDSEVRSST